MAKDDCGSGVVPPPCAGDRGEGRSGAAAAVRAGRSHPGVVVDGGVDKLRRADRTPSPHAQVHQARQQGRPPGCRQPADGGRQIDLPWVPQKEFAKALPLLARRPATHAVEDCVLDFLAYEEVLDDDGSRMLRGLLVAAGGTVCSRWSDAIEAAGLSVVSTLTPLATLGAVADAHAAVLGRDRCWGDDQRHDQEHGQPHFVRILSRGGQDITTALARHWRSARTKAER